MAMPGEFIRKHDNVPCEVPQEMPKQIPVENAPELVPVLVPSKREDNMRRY